MNIKTRRSIFYFFLFLFFIAGLGVIFYSLGWRLNAENCSVTRLSGCSAKLQKVGGIFVETKPKGVTIKIDGKVFSDKSGIIQSGTLINNLLPKNYRVEIGKEGYLGWEKNAAVKSGMVTEISKVILIPDKLEKKPVISSTTVDNFWINSGEKIIFESKANVYYWLQNSSSKLRGDEFIASDNGDKIITRDSAGQIYYLYDVTNLSKTFNISAALNSFQKMTIKKIAFNPLESNRLVIEGKNGLLYLLDINRSKLENIVKSNVMSWTIKDASIYYVKETQNSGQKTKSYFLASYNLVSKTENFSFELPDLNGQKILEISASGNKTAFLTETGGLYLFNEQTQKSLKIADSAGNFSFSPDDKKIAFMDKGGKINVYFCENYQNGVSRKAGETIEINLFEQSGLTVKNVFWYKDSSHLFVDYFNPDGKENIDFVEVDDRLPINKYTLIDNASNFYYAADSSRLYFIQEKNLYFIEI